ncbi:DUF4352 domain-containing protein [Micromonospora sp. A3M-1-15]|uniref:DUF4352 domain-containing protein n=1 Tax=Micromonospora sp. A3M-1-15 TaxID=2962035 RepID=UPI0020B6E543|nr:DUF4352 domain-containing protein [Micromonospora sp. A3M-1-15]MCP3785258.1 DUF4352 domain-containing protein [Micromonospora sp. A3M-1-15]
MTTPYDPAQNQPGQQPMPPTAQFPQVPAGQFPSPPGQVFHADGTITALDASGREHDVDGEAALYGNDDAKGFLDEIIPGNSVKANVYFEVPMGTKLRAITIAAGIFTLAEDAVVTP